MTTKNGTDPVERVYRHIGKVIKEQREKRGLIQQAIADKLKLSRASICMLEKGKQRVMMHDLPRIAEALGVPVIELIPPEWKRGEA